MRTEQLNAVINNLRASINAFGGAHVLPVVSFDHEEECYAEINRCGTIFLRRIDALQVQLQNKREIEQDVDVFSARCKLLLDPYAEIDFTLRDLTVEFVKLNRFLTRHPEKLYVISQFRLALVPLCNIEAQPASTHIKQFLELINLLSTKYLEIEKFLSIDQCTNLLKTLRAAWNFSEMLTPFVLAYEKFCKLIDGAICDSIADRVISRRDNVIRQSIFGASVQVDHRQVSAMVSSVILVMHHQSRIIQSFNTAIPEWSGWAAALFNHSDYAKCFVNRFNIKPEFAGIFESAWPRQAMLQLFRSARPAVANAQELLVWSNQFNYSVQQINALIDFPNLYPNKKTLNDYIAGLTQAVDDLSVQYEIALEKCHYLLSNRLPHDIRANLLARKSYLEQVFSDVKNKASDRLLKARLYRNETQIEVALSALKSAGSNNYAACFVVYMHALAKPRAVSYRDFDIAESQLDLSENKQKAYDVVLFLAENPCYQGMVMGSEFENNFASFEDIAQWFSQESNFSRFISNLVNVYNYLKNADVDVLADLQNAIIETSGLKFIKEADDLFKLFGPGRYGDTHAFRWLCNFLATNPQQQMTCLGLNRPVKMTCSGVARFFANVQQRLDKRIEVGADSVQGFAR